MASIGILLFIFTVIQINAGNAFIKVQCKTENVGQYGQKSLLECVINTAQEIGKVEIRVVTWKKDEKPLLIFVDGQTKLEGPYSFAEPSWNSNNMNVSLLITNTAVDNEGVYTCMVITDSGDGSSDTSFKVTAKYSVPTIHPTPETITQNTGGSLMCRSSGGYPKGQLRWFDEHNMEWTKSAKMEVKQAEGLFNLSSELSLLQGSTFSKYTCKVFNASGGKEDEATFEITEKPEGRGQPERLNQSYSKIFAPVLVIGSLIVGLLLALLVYKRRSQRARRQSAAPLMGEHEVYTSGSCEDDDLKKGGKSQDSLP